MHEFKRFIQQQLDARGWKQADLVRKSGLSKQHVSNMLRDTREHLGQMPDEKTIRALADGFQLPAEVVRTAASRALAGYSDEGQPLHVDIHQVPLDTLLNEIRRRFEEIGDSHGSSTEEIPEPRTQAGSPEHRGSTGGDRGRPGASMKPRKVRRLKPADQGRRIDDLPPWDEKDELAAFDPGDPF
ncbi:helix-turn-helix domain-containing protein [Rhodococcus aetherivorans]|uniref:helix-turn-helix domain-containing protein n=1 Tax=Rhodococcus aetherivorans TaxID=191292 RepID=UPI0031E2FE16